jgi:uncharacterized protein YyaL (SSP411 family)
MTTSVHNETENALAAETSPYLLQHAHNPVEWFPWCDEALAKARSENKPILLSIGYSACHWCHVMAHESFENPETAAIMNQLFINIKVDREERPDLDKIYQTAHQFLNHQAGGWPLTVFLTPDKLIPFFSGTYFPPENRYGRPSFTAVLENVERFFQEHMDEIEQQNNNLLGAFARLDHALGENVAFNDQPVTDAIEAFHKEYDTDYGGFGGAPKFPHPATLQFLLTRNGSNIAQHMALTTLGMMGAGGIYDHLGGGFFRYSVDERWEIPHFEKMLYDNGSLLYLYSLAWEVSKQGNFRRIAEETGNWLLREMHSADDAFYAAMDADSEGEEGKFYVWDQAELQSVLSPQEYAFVEQVYGLNQPANFEGKWHLCQKADHAQVAAALQLNTQQAFALQTKAFAKLLSARETRINPGLDNKILTSWNALIIKGLAKAGSSFQRDDFITAAAKAIEFFRDEMFLDEYLMATFQGGKPKIIGYLDDHAFLIDAILEYLQVDWRDDFLAFAMELADIMVNKFADHENGGFFFTAIDQEQLFHRPKSAMDEAMPSGAGVAAQVLLRLGHLLAEPRYLETAAKALQHSWPGISQYAHAYPSMLIALDELLTPAKVIILKAKSYEHAIPALRELAALKKPADALFHVPDSPELPPALAEKASQGDFTVYVCQGETCLEPATDLQSLGKLF